MTTNSELYINDSEFKDNYSKGRGSILFGEVDMIDKSLDEGSSNIRSYFFSESSQNSFTVFTNCNFTHNFAVQGGILHATQGFQVAFDNCIIKHSFASEGGIAYI